MKKMFLWLSIPILTACMLAGCTGKKEPESTPKPTRPPESTPPPAPLYEQYGAYDETPMNLNGRKIVFGTTNIGRWDYAADKDATINDVIWSIEQIHQIEKDSS